MSRAATTLPKKISDAEDREFKFCAMRTASNGKKPDPVLQQWLNRYMAPPAIRRPPGYVPGGLVMERVLARKMEREKRRAFMHELRNRPHRGPPLIMTRAPQPPASPIRRGPTLQQRLADYEAAKDRKAKLTYIVGLRERALLKRASQRKTVRENAARRAKEHEERKAQREHRAQRL